MSAVLEMQITPATVVLGLLLVALVVLAIRRLRNKGLCDHKDSCEFSSKKGGCSGCSSASKMLEKIEEDMKS